MLGHLILLTLVDGLYPLRLGFISPMIVGNINYAVKSMTMKHIRLITVGAALIMMARLIHHRRVSALCFGMRHYYDKQDQERLVFTCLLSLGIEIRYLLGKWNAKLLQSEFASVGNWSIG